MQAPEQGHSRSSIDEGRDAGREYVIRPADRDLFVRTGAQIIESCRLGISVQLWFDELQSMVERARQWAEERPSRVRSCYCSAGGKRVTLFVVPALGRFDFDLADEIVDLNTELVKDFNVGRVEVGQVPWAELNRFVDVGSATHVFGEVYGEQPTGRAETPPPVAAQP
jgi:hypothetical protein